jgi:proline iminopeptidase
MTTKALWIFILNLMLFDILSAQEKDPFKSDTLLINGTKLFVKTVGEGEPLLFIHGGPGLSHDYFLPHVLPLSDKFKLIFYDQRATGRSDIKVDSSHMSIDYFVDDIESLRKHYHINKINLIGHSWGGFLAALYAIKYPKTTKSLVFWDSSPLSSHLRNVMIENQKSKVTKEDVANNLKIMRSEEFKRGDPAEIARLYKAIFKPSVFIQKLVYKLNFYFNQNYNQTQYLLGFMYHSMVKYDYYPKLKKVKAPALIFFGNYDPMPVESSEELHNRLSNSELIILKDCGHFPFLEKPQEVFPKMRDFYQKNSSKKTK